MRRVLSALVIFASVTAAACSDDGSGVEAQVEGTYNLQTLGGQALPFVVEEDGIRFEYVSSQLVINTNNTFTVGETIRITESGTTQTETFSSDGTWTRTASNVRFSFRDEETGQTETITAVWNGDNQIMITDEGGLIYVYRK